MEIEGISQAQDNESSCTECKRVIQKGENYLSLHEDVPHQGYDYAIKCKKCGTKYLDERITDLEDYKLMLR